MSDVSVTSADVLPGSSSKPNVNTAGAAITAGQAIYLDPTSQTMKLAEANSTAVLAAALGIAVSGAASGQPVAWIAGGIYTVGGTVVRGTTYVVSAATAGGIAPQADLASGDYVTVLGIGYSTTQILLGINATGIQV